MSTPTTSGWRLVATREMSVKLRDKTFLVSTAFMLVVVAGWIGFSSWQANRTSEVRVAVTEPAAASLVEQAGAEGGRTVLTGVDADSATAAEQAVRAGDADLALLPRDGAWEVVGEREVDSGASDLLAEAVRTQVLEDNAAAAGTTSQELLAGTVLDQRLLDAGAMDGGLRYLLAFAFAFLFFITALTFGLAIAQSVIEEKQSRVVEILAATIPVRALLWGKVVGNSVLAIGQVVLLAAVGLIGLQVSGQGALLSFVGPAGLWFVLFFVLGFAALACLWAVAGSVATRQEDLGSTTTPVQTVVMGAMFLGIAGSGNVLTVASFVPLVSSVAMPVRMLDGDVPLWQPMVSAALVVVAAVALVRLGARLYEGSLLRTDRRTSYREAMRSAG